MQSLFIIDYLRFTKYLAEYQKELLYETCYSFLPIPSKRSWLENSYLRACLLVICCGFG